MNIFNTAYHGILKHLRTDSGLIYKNVNMETGDLAAVWIDSLAAFFPGLQVIAGDLDNAIKHHYLYFEIWQRYSALPERFNLIDRDTAIASYPLRPELIESTYLLYQVIQY